MTQVQFDALSRELLSLRALLDGIEQRLQQLFQSPPLSRIEKRFDSLEICLAGIDDRLGAIGPRVK